MKIFNYVTYLCRSLFELILSQKQSRVGWSPISSLRLAEY